MYTGNTLSIFSGASEESVYPCVYREHIFDALIHSNVIGLSLCIQGTHAFGITVNASNRFIPVYTGNTLVCTELELPRVGLSLCIQGTQ